MAKLILKANLADSGFIVAQKVIDIPINISTKPSDTEVMISPVGNNIISVEDFSTGILPNNIKLVVGE